MTINNILDYMSNAPPKDLQLIKQHLNNLALRKKEKVEQRKQSLTDFKNHFYKKTLKK